MSKLQIAATILAGLVSDRSRYLNAERFWRNKELSEREAYCRTVQEHCIIALNYADCLIHVYNQQYENGENQ